jgi:hypothetical protein
MLFGLDRVEALERLMVEGNIYGYGSVRCLGPEVSSVDSRGDVNPLVPPHKRTFDKVGWKGRSHWVEGDKSQFTVIGANVGSLVDSIARVCVADAWSTANSIVSQETR